ncbi:hypothetical protein C8Q76DRAFT_790733 [Earliella scabrosa]|nr:hypothetical protein C8Q76DRAFT_790733 [Earliella scabrosa]
MSHITDDSTPVDDALGRLYGIESEIFGLAAASERESAQFQGSLGLPLPSEDWLDSFVTRTSLDHQHHRQGIKQRLYDSNKHVGLLYGRNGGASKAYDHLKASITLMSEQCEVAYEIFDQIQVKHQQSTALQIATMPLRRTLEELRDDIMQLKKEDQSLQHDFLDRNASFLVLCKEDAFGHAVEKLRSAKICEDTFKALSAPLFARMAQSGNERREILQELQVISARETRRVLQGGRTRELAQLRMRMEANCAQERRLERDIKDVADRAQRSPSSLEGLDGGIPLSQFDLLSSHFESILFESVRIREAASALIKDMKRSL